MLKLALSLVLLSVVFGLAGTAFVGLVALDLLRAGVAQVAALISLLLETWVIQAAFGAWVAFQLQERSATIARRKDALQLAYDRKLEATKTLYRLIEKRLYASRRYLTVLEEEPASLADERSHYRSIVAEWNETVKISQVTILLEFNGVVGLSLDNRYFPNFAEIDDLLRLQRKLVESGKSPAPAISKTVRTLLADLNWRSLTLVREMLKQARRDRNILNEEVPISEENVPHLSYGRLLKALIEPA